MQLACIPSCLLACSATRPILSDAFAGRQSTSDKVRGWEERHASVKSTHGHDMRRVKKEAKKKDQGYSLLQASQRTLYGRPIWPGIRSRYTSVERIRQTMQRQVSKAQNRWEQTC
jgi:hypothetical protein